MKEYERKLLIERIEREGATVGASIPEQIEVQGTEVDLQQFVFEIKRRETIPEGERETVDQAKKNLRREKIERRERIENEEVTFEKGEELVESIIGIDRALEALQSLGPANIEGELQATEAADQKRWMGFLKKVLGKDSGPRLGGR
jgi:hypothetical protein